MHFYVSSRVLSFPNYNNPRVMGSKMWTIWILVIVLLCQFPRLLDHSVSWKKVKDFFFNLKFSVKIEKPFLDTVRHLKQISQNPELLSSPPRKCCFLPKFFSFPPPPKIPPRKNVPISFFSLCFCYLEPKKKPRFFFAMRKKHISHQYCNTYPLFSLV